MSSERMLAIRAAAIRTMDRERPEAECLAWRRGRIEAVGSYAEVKAYVGASAEWLDLREATIVPGLSDSHIHLVEWALGRGVDDLSDARSMAEVLERVRAAARSAPAGGWLEFKGWDPALRPQAELSDLDEAAGGHAVSLIAHDLHSGWLSSEALGRLGIGSDRAEPPGGSLERDEDGRLTGVLRERALDWWYEGRPRPGYAERRSALLEGQAALHRLGVTAVHSVEGPESLRLLQDLEAAGNLRLRVLHHLPQRFLDALIDSGVASGFGSRWLRIGGIKYFTDGALGSSTAWMLEPYVESEERGVCRLEPAEFRADVERAAQAGLAATVHAIGDAAVRMTVAALEQAGAPARRIPHRIEHLQCVHPEDMGRPARAGIVASMQPSHLLTDIPIAEARWGPERCRGMMALRRLREAGTTFAFGSDAPVEAPDPREGFFAAMARRDRRGYPEGGWHSEERLTGAEVLWGYTVGPARAAGDADRRGRLTPGFLADFAAWDTDPASAEPDRIRSARVLATVVGGEVVFEDRATG